MPRITAYVATAASAVERSERQELLVLGLKVLGLRSLHLEREGLRSWV
jgi:hypothetical protein